MTVTWECICGRKFESGHEAFIHRDGNDSHHVSPQTMELVPIPIVTPNEWREKLNNDEVIQ